MLLNSTDPRPAPSRDPVAPPAYYEADVQALRALQVGAATEDQQRRACEFIVRHLCGTYDVVFRPDSERLTSFAAGKQWCGQMLVWFFNSAPTRTDPAEIAARPRARRASTGE